MTEDIENNSNAVNFRDCRPSAQTMSVTSTSTRADSQNGKKVKNAVGGNSFSINKS